MSAEERLWGEAHRREGLRCILRLFDRMAAAVAEVPPAGEAAVTMATLGSEESLRADLAALAEDAPYITIDIDREVRRVRDLAEGRRVREEHAGYQYRVRVSNNSEPSPLLDLSTARFNARAWRRAYPGSTTKIVPVKVTRIRRAP